MLKMTRKCQSLTKSAQQPIQDALYKWRMDILATGAEPRNGLGGHVNPTFATGCS